MGRPDAKTNQTPYPSTISMSPPGSIRKKSNNHGAAKGCARRKNEVALDAYYTPRHLILWIQSTVIEMCTNNQATFVDFSCGDNRLCDSIKKHTKVFAMDIVDHPHNDATADFLKTSRESFPPGNLVVGFNPPFGYRAVIARKFVNHAASLSPVAMVLLLPRFPCTPDGTFTPEGYMLTKRHALGKVTFVSEPGVLSPGPAVPCDLCIYTKSDAQTCAPSLRSDTRGCKNLRTLVTSGSVSPDWWLCPEYLFVASAGSGSGQRAWYVQDGTLKYIYADGSVRESPRHKSSNVSDLSTYNITCVPMGLIGSPLEIPNLFPKIAARAREHMKLTGKGSLPIKIICESITRQTELRRHPHQIQRGDRRIGR